MKKTAFKRSVLALCLALVFLLSACGTAANTPAADPGTTVTPAPQSGSTAENAQSGEKEPSGSEVSQQQPSGGDTASTAVKAESLIFVSSYDELKKVIEERRAAASASGYGGGYWVKGDDARDEEVPAASNGMSEQFGAGGADDYSVTNVQVEGVDECDFVKTDGKYIYILSGTDLAIGSPNGDGTFSLLSRVQIFESNGDSYDYYSDETGEYEYRYRSEDFNGMYVEGTTVVMITNTWGYHEYGGVDEHHYDNYNLVNAYFYDVSDPEMPAFITMLSQDGNYLDSRMYNGTLYLLSSYWSYNSEDDDNPYVPWVYTDGVKSRIAVEDIAILPVEGSDACTVVCAYDVEGASLSDSEAVFGAGSYIYMNGDTLCLSNCTSDCDESEPRTESVYTVIDRTYTRTTHIAMFSVAGGAIEPGACGSVPGYLESQFSMDIYNGYLRMVTTVSGYSYSVYTDSEYGFENYVWDKEEPTTNALYILDGDLNVCGSIEGLAENERIYSARFDGDICYFVTFRSVDPLFAADLSDPTAPVILSALKIPGFSEYLHVYKDGLLFGLGQSVSDTTNRTTGLKLSMFDVSDPADVTEKHTLSIDADYTTALYNHKAILVSAAKNVIAFPADDGYLIYGYDDADGFYLRASTESGGDWWGDPRGLWIGDYFYVIDRYSNTVTVLDLEELEFTGTYVF